ncbi:SGNH/GDSL hydrolase family protein [Paeniglutamicibacter kerguelensis]|uniref:Lysophospholipase L1-like esterase n=1 Tax=Paeniglutamicibacter kerguelensis TaxID=254788 RepID=A0ABS4X9G8_9MICC|nr:SGNH/GDSL hydrolase family protein [Paeniglutamicibacter kerguelensis]MBP2385102.1 lysophospholipase L1-like esterase [Paeniglutamicibacter kerguelensis]
MDARTVASLGAESIPDPTTPTETFTEQVEPTKNPALGVLLAAYTRAPTESVVVVSLGSSTTAGVDQVPADRWVNKLCAAMQSRYASGPGRDSTPGNLASPRNTLPGIHFYNGGLPGTRSNTYLDSAMVGQIKALAPSVITYMIGSNDARDGAPATRYRVDMLRSLDAIDAVLPQPHTHVLIHAHERSDHNVTALWDEYRAVLQGIAQDRPRSVAFLDVSRDFEAIGFPKSDPLDFLKEDRIHLTPAGHDFVARILAQELMATPRNVRTAISDSFARANGPLGAADSGQRWIGSPGSQFTISGGKASITTDGSAIADSSLSNVDASMSITHTGADNHPAGILVRADPSTGAGIGLFITAGTGQQVSLNVSDGATNPEIWHEARAIAPGDHEVRLVVVGNTCVAYLDGALVKAISLPARAASLAGNTGAGFGCGAPTRSVAFGRIIVRES